MTRENTQEKSGQTVVMVIGMHRSGTSLLSSFVQALGINIGDRLYPADNYNPAGYFEDHECMEIQERILEGLGRQWHTEQGMLPFPSAWWREAAMRPFVEELENWVDRRLSSSGRIWAFKDPRTTRFLPLWQELFQSRGITACYILAVRNPSEVVASVTNRSAVPTRQIYRTWLRYNMEALLVGGKELAGVFDYANWFTDGIAQLRRLALILGRNLKDDELTIILGSLLCEKLYHQNVDGQISPAWALKFYEGLRQIAGNLDEAYIAHLATEAEYFDAMLRQGEEPAIEGPVEAVFSSKEGLPAALQLAQDLRERGTRVVVGVTETTPEVTTAEAPVLLVESNGPVLKGWLHTLATYSLWRWLQSRAYAAVHIEGGYGLAAHCLVGRNQGWSDRCGSIYVRYFSSPAWLEENGNVHLRGVLDAEALYLEQRVLSDPACQIHAHPALYAVLRRVLVESSPADAASVPVPRGEPLVSICITHHNRPLLLHDCLESVRAQTYGKFEVVLVDDGSTEPRAHAFLDSLKEEFEAKNWTLIRQENRYLGAARNMAARAARGEYLFMLDDDNLLLPDGIQRAVLVAQQTGADIVTAVMQMFYGQAGHRPTLPDMLWVQTGSSLLLGLLENNFGDANALIRHECWTELGGYTEDRGLGAEDWEFYAKAVFLGRRLEHSLKPFSWYRMDSNSMSRAGDWWSDHRRALRPYEAVLPPVLRELPALTSALKQRVAELEPFEPAAFNLREQVDQLRVLLMTAESRLAEMQGQLVRVQQEADSHLVDAQGQLLQMQQALETLDHARRIIYASSSWRLTAPLRAVKRWTIDLRSGIRRSFIRKVIVSIWIELRRHGFLGFIRHFPYYLKRRNIFIALFGNRKPGLDVNTFRSVSLKRDFPINPDIMGPDIMGDVATIDGSIAVIIPTLNAGAEFPWLIRKLKAQRGVREIVIVIVDSGSTDGTPEVARAAGCTVIEIPPAEFSHSGTRNLGAEHATTDYLLFMVQDAYPIGEYWAYGMLRYLYDHKHEDVVAVSCSEYSRSDSDMMYDCMIDTHYRFLGCRDDDRLGRLLGTDHMALRQQGQLSDIACLIDRQTFSHYPYRGNYAEDLDLGIRIIRGGQAVALLSSVKVIHSHRRSVYYYFKRSFVDVIFLLAMFDDMTYPDVKSSEGMIAGICSTAAHLSEWLQRWKLSSSEQMLGDELAGLIKQWRQEFTRGKFDGACQLGDERFDTYIDDLSVRFLSRERREYEKTWREERQSFLDMFFGRLEHFNEYASQVYGCMDARLRAEMADAICKTFAATAGSIIGFFYMHAKGTLGRDRDLAEKFYQELNVGV
jgi:O-antigen biosynthesis protein